MADSGKPARFATLLPKLMPYSAIMNRDAPTGPGPRFVTVGNNPARAFGMDAAARADALAVKAGLEPGEDGAGNRGALYADLGWAWDPEWLAALAETPGRVLTKDGVAVIAHVAAGGDAGPVLAAMRAGAPFAGASLESVDADTADFSYRKLRKRERPFVPPMTPATRA